LSNNRADTTNEVPPTAKGDAVVEHRSLNLQLKMMSKAMEFGFQLNSKELTVSEWIELCKELKNLSQKN